MSEVVSGQAVEEQILNATCGGRTIWHGTNKDHDDTLYIDRREEPAGFHGQDGRTYGIDPDEVQDFRDLPYPNGSFNLIVFDPPHEVRPNGMGSLTGYQVKKYGALHAETWQADLRSGFGELWRVLRPGGTLVFKFSSISLGFNQVLSVLPRDPLFGTTSKKTSTETRWFVFYKDSDENGGAGGAGSGANE